MSRSLWNQEPSHIEISDRPASVFMARLNYSCKQSTNGAEFRGTSLLLRRPSWADTPRNCGAVEALINPDGFFAARSIIRTSYIATRMKLR